MDIKKMRAFLRVDQATIGMPCDDHIEYREDCRLCAVVNTLSGVCVVLSEMQDQVDSLQKKISNLNSRTNGQMTIG